MNEKIVREPSGHTRRMRRIKCAGCGADKWAAVGAIKNKRALRCRSCSNKTHGYSKLAAYKAWYAMLHRCNAVVSQAYATYGGRGITVSKRWLQFENFYADMGDCPKELTLERINNNAGYKKSNCTWATRAEQSVNRSTTIWLTAFGKTQHLSAWAREKNIRIDTLHLRLKRGWDVKRALTEKVRTT
jgi:DNA-directed RNA polymerase subunit RPC12/RpoP